MGFKMAGFHPVATLDSFGPGTDTYRRNFPDVPPEHVICSDASAPNAIDDFLDATALKRGRVKVVVGGPPCQGFSVAGRVKLASLESKQNARKNPRFIEDPRNLLYKSFIEFVRHLQPEVVVIENVTGMLSYKNGAVVDEIKGTLKSIGYPECDHRVLNAADYGVPQMRRRVFFMAGKKGMKIAWPEPTHITRTGSDSLLPRTTRPHVTVWDAISDLPRISRPEKGDRLENSRRKYSSGPSCSFQRSMRGSLSHVENNITRWHRKKDLKVFKKMHNGDKWADLSDENRRMIGYSDKSFNDKWRRLPMDKPSWTVTSHLSRDGYMFIHPTQCRTISVREAARLQSFPDQFVFKGSRSAQFQQIGNAVPPLLAAAIARAVNKLLKRQHK